MSDCDWAEPRLGAWFDGELQAREARQVMAHVERCTACERRHRMLVETSAALRALGRVAQGVAPVRGVRRPRRWLWVAAAAAVVAIGAGALYLNEASARRPLADDCAHCGPEPFAPPQRVNDVAQQR